MTGVVEQPERWKRAVDTIEDVMAQAVGRAYVARYFSSETKAQIADLTSKLRIALKARIERLDWMSQQTKRKALDKLASLNVEDRLSGQMAGLLGPGGAARRSRRKYRSRLEV